MGDEKLDYRPGDKIPGTVYRVIRLIGAGGMGTVYDVEDTTVGKRYVLKTLHPELCNREDLAKRMEQEARTLARLQHPNIVEVVTAGATTDDLRLPYYVMEKLNGQNLRVILNKKRSLELPHALHITIDLLDALDCAHDKNVIHRDVKPDNIFLHRTPNGVTLTKLLDFGIMRLIDAGPSVTGGRFMGTLRFAAPEQLNGGNITAQTDLYAAGLVLYETIAGRGPFDEEGASERIARAHVHRQAPPLFEWGVIVPQTLEKLIASALAKNPEKRPKDAFTFAAQLRNLAQILQADSPSRERDSQRLAVAVSVDVAKPPPVLTLPSPLSPVALAETLPASTRASTPAAKAPGSNDTVRGMVRPTLSGAPLEAAGGTLVSWDHESEPQREAGRVDRAAETRSMPPEEPPRLGPAGTEPIPISPATAPWSKSPSAALAGRDTVREPLPAGAIADPSEAVAQALLVALPTHEQFGTRSDGASVSTLLPPPQAADRRRTLAVAVVGICSFAIVATGSLALALRLHRSSAGTEAEAPGVFPSAAVPAPTIAPPLDLEEAPSVPAASGVPPVASTAPANVAPSSAPSADLPPRPKPVPRPARLAPAQGSPAVPPAAAPTPVKKRLPGSGL